MSPTTVRNLRDGTYDPTNPDHIYCGRANRRWHLAESKWANPIPLRRECDREAVIEGYRDHLRRWPELVAGLHALQGKTLYCWCRPKEGFRGRLLCHCQVLAGLADGIAPEEVE